MESLDRRNFLKKSAASTAGMMVGAPMIAKNLTQRSPNETINVAAAGIRSWGFVHNGGGHCVNLAKIHFGNWIDCIRSRKWQALTADILEGHMSTAMMHLGNISYRTWRKLHFNPSAERFVNDEDADMYLTRNYRPPYVLPDQV